MNLRPLRPLVLLALLALASSCSNSSSPTTGGEDDNGPTVTWSVNQFGSTAGDFVFALAPAAGGGVYATGLTENALPGQSNLGGYDAFLLQLGENGQIIRSQQLGTPYNDFGKGLAADSSGNVYVGGYTYGDLEDDTVKYIGTKCFVIKFDAYGNERWHVEFGSSNDAVSDEVHALAANDSGFFAVGSTYGDLFETNKGDRDAFVVNYRWDETRQVYGLYWSAQPGGPAVDDLHAVLATEDGGALVAGETYNSLGDANKGENDIFFIRYDSAGNQVWLKQMGTPGNDVAYALAMDGNGGFYLAGMSNGDIANGEQQGANDAFVARFDSGGNLVWIHQLGTGGLDTARALAPDGKGGVYVVGTTDGEMVSGTYGGLEDVFVAHYDSNGNLLWVSQKGTSDNDEGRAAAAVSDSQVFVGGTTRGDLAGPGSQVGEYDAFIAVVGP